MNRKKDGYSLNHERTEDQKNKIQWDDEYLYNTSYVHYYCIHSHCSVNNNQNCVFFIKFLVMDFSTKHAFMPWNIRMI